MEGELIAMEASRDRQMLNSSSSPCSQTAINAVRASTRFHTFAVLAADSRSSEGAPIGKSDSDPEALTTAGDDGDPKGGILGGDAAGKQQGVSHSGSGISTSDSDDDDSFASGDEGEDEDADETNATWHNATDEQEGQGDSASPHDETATAERVRKLDSSKTTVPPPDGPPEEDDDVAEEMAEASGRGKKDQDGERVNSGDSNSSRFMDKVHSLGDRLGKAL